MKKIILFITFIGLVSLANAQKIFPSPLDNPFWTEEHDMLYGCWCGGGGDCQYYSECTMPVHYKTDTIIDGKIYNRLYTCGVDYCHYIVVTTPDYSCNDCNYTTPETLLATIRQDTINKIVYLWDGTKDTVLYNFNNIIVGRPYPITVTNPLGSDTLVVVSEDSLYLNHTYYKRWNLGLRYNGTISNSGFVSVIEGIGSTFGIKTVLQPPFENYDQLLCFSLNNVVIYPDSAYNCDITLNINEHKNNQIISVYPNPATDNLTIESTQQGIIEITNIEGQLIETLATTGNKTNIDVSAFAKGMYFVKVKTEKGVMSRKFVKL